MAYGLKACSCHSLILCFYFIIESHSKLNSRGRLVAPIANTSMYGSGLFKWCYNVNYVINWFSLSQTADCHCVCVQGQHNPGHWTRRIRAEGPRRIEKSAERSPPSKHGYAHRVLKNLRALVCEVSPLDGTGVIRCGWTYVCYGCPTSRTCTSQYHLRSPSLSLYKPRCPGVKKYLVLWMSVLSPNIKALVSIESRKGGEERKKQTGRRKHGWVSAIVFWDTQKVPAVNVTFRNR